MEQLEKVVKGLECCVLRDPDDHRRCGECPYNPHAISNEPCANGLKFNALALIRQQQERIKALEAWKRVNDMARLITEEDFKKADAWGIIPAWIEYRPELESAEDGWELIDCNVFHNVFKRAWTQMPTDEQREAAAWQ